MLLRILIATILLGLVSCTQEQKRIELIEERTGLELPEKYLITRNESVDEGSFDGDFTIYIDLQFDEANFKLLKDNIENSKDLGRWTKNESGIKFTSTDPNEPAIMEIDEKARTLKFEIHHI